MAEIVVLPVIRSEDYAAFRRDVGPKLVGTYEEWAMLFASEVANARKQGKIVVETVINYEEFTRYCRRKGFDPDPVILRDFAMTQKPLGEA
jgi:hypothetical protein